MTWFEVARSTQAVSDIADFRTNGFPFPKEGRDIIPASTGGTTILTVGVDPDTQSINGSATLIADFIISLSTVGAIDGDIFKIQYTAQIIEGAFKVKIGGVSPYTLSTSQALIGGWFLVCHFDSGAWLCTVFPDASAVDFELESKFIGSGAITIPKLAGTLAVGMIPFTVTFETDEIGDIKITMPFNGTVTGIDYAVSKLIEATDDGSIIAKDNAAAVMATTSIAGGSAIGTIFSESPSVNNTFVAGDILTFTSAKPTVGGKVLVSLKIIRT